MMNLTLCPDCGGSISKDANACPHCGRSTGRIAKRVKIGILIAFVLGVVALLIYEADQRARTVIEAQHDLARKAREFEGGRP